MLCRIHTLCICRKRGQEPIHVRLRQRASGLNEEVRQEGCSVQPVIPIDMARIMAVEPGLHDDGPYVYTDIENNHNVQADLCSSALAEAFHVEDKT